jgi:hypothetical protein
VPSENIVVTLVGQRYFVTELLQNAYPRYRVQGEVSFRPVERTTYTVKGMLEPICCSVWIEDQTGVEVPGTRVMMPTNQPGTARP